MNLPCILLSVENPVESVDNWFSFVSLGNKHRKQGKNTTSPVLHGQVDCFPTSVESRDHLPQHGVDCAKQGVENISFSRVFSTFFRYVFTVSTKGDRFVFFYANSPHAFQATCERKNPATTLVLEQFQLFHRPYDEDDLFYSIL